MDSIKTVEDLIAAINSHTERIMKWAHASVVDEGCFRRWVWKDGSNATLDQAIAKIGRHPAVHNHMRELTVMQTMLSNLTPA